MDKTTNYITIKVEPVVRNDDYNKRKNTFNDGPKYTVREADVARAMLFLERLLKACKLSSARAYPVRFESVLQSRIATKKEMFDQIVSEALRLGTIEEESVEKIKKLSI